VSVLNLDPSKLIVVAIVILIVLGPDKLPQFARQIGAAWRSMSAFHGRLESEVRSSIPDLPSTTELARYARSPAALLDRLSPEAPAEEERPARLDADSELPVVARSSAGHWTTRWGPDPSAVAVNADTEEVRLDAEAPFLGDAGLN
jgi:Sec-independent protein translocase protein TatA